MFSADDIRRCLPEISYVHGKTHQQAGHARVTELSADEAVVRGEVSDGKRAPYRVFAQIGQTLIVGRDGRIEMTISSSCSCPLGHACKHVAALLFQVIAQRDAGPAPSSQALISDEVAQWLAAIDYAGKTGVEDYPREIRKRLIYVLTLTADWGGIRRFRVSPVSVQLLKDGSFSPSQQRPYDPATPFNSTPGKFLRPSDLVILRRLHLSGTRHGGTGHDGRGLEGEEGAEILAMILKTGRARWQSLDGPALTQGDVRSGQIKWAVAADGRQRPELAVEGGAQAGILAPPWYVDPPGAICGPVELGMPPKVAATFLAAPPLTPVEAASVRARLAASLPDGPRVDSVLPLPSELAAPRQIGGKPTPRLLLHTRLLEPAPYWSYSSRGQKTPAAEVALAGVSFLYETIEIPAGDNRQRSVSMSGGQLIEVARALNAERAAIAQLTEIGFRRPTMWQVPADGRNLFSLDVGDPMLDEESWIDFLSDAAPGLIARGWRIDFAKDFPYRLAAAESDIEAALTEGSGIDWFELDLGVRIDGERVDILPALLRAIRQFSGDALTEFLAEDPEAPPVRLRLDDGRILPLAFDRIRPILIALAELFDASGEAAGGRMILRPRDAADLAEFEQASGLVWKGGEALRALGRRLRDGTGFPEVATPASFSGSLRPYQQSGLGWLQFLRETELGGVLADDMGLGKTVQVLAHLAVEKEAGRLDRPCLVVAPTSLMPNWRSEAAVFTPELKVLVQHGSDRKASFDALTDHDVVLTTFALLARDIDVLAPLPWHMVIVDEAQFIKNPATAAAKALRRLDARHRLALTGTPLENHLGELWALFDFVSPGFLGDAKSFAKSWRAPIEKKGDRDRQKRLARRVRPFLLRRTKGEVATELPPKTEIQQSIELGRFQRDLYDGIRLTMHQKVREAIAAKGLKRSRIELLDALLKLRQACCDPRLVKTAGRHGVTKAGSAKLERLMEMTPELIEEGRRILLFSQFTSMLALIEAELATVNIPYVMLTGDTRDRETPVGRFQRGEVPLFLISLRAGGTGLNLTAADTVIHYDPWWNPAVEAQATDRAHRIGQDKPVFVHRLVALDTIEVKMAELKARKQALADGLFDPDAGNTLDISEDDVEFLLGADLT